MMVRMQIQFTAEQAATYRAESARHGLSISEIVRRRCDSAPPLFPDRTRALARLRRAKHQSDIPDLMENHDLYIDPDYEP